MKEYGVKFFELEDGEESEIDMDVLPDDYVAGLIWMLKEDLAGRRRLNGVHERLADDCR